MAATTGRTVTSKALAILGAFEDGPATLTLTELAAAAELPKPTAHRLVAELVEWGALRRDPVSGRYRIGRRLWAIGQKAGRELRDSARTTLTDLFTRTGETCQLAIRDGDQALVIDRLYGPHEALRSTKAGDRLPLHATAVGRVLLAFEEPWLAEAYLAGPVHADRRARLADDLAGVRQRGYAALGQETPAGASLAVPVLVAPGLAVAALGIVTPTALRRQSERHLAALRAAARKIEPEAERWPNTRAVVATFESS